MEARPRDLIVLGAGISGISAARIYLDIHPKADIVIIERDRTVGGTWNRGRLYPGCKAQASSRMCEFSDMPISIPPGGEDENGCPDAIHISSYLELYVDQHIYDGKPLKDRIFLDSSITRAEKAKDSLWHVRFTQFGVEREFISSKLLVATGTTSLPNIPNFLGKENFHGPIIHSIDFGRSWPLVQTSQSIKNVTVVGAGKSSADFVYQLVKAGKMVTWLIRKSGKGAAHLVNAKAPPGFRNTNELASTRLFTRLFISGLNEKSWWDWFLWNTTLGNAFHNWYENIAASMASAGADFDSRKGAREGFKLLKNKRQLNHITAPAGMVQFADFWETVAQNVNIIRADVKKLDYHKIVLEDGSSVDADAIMLGTGYEQRLPYFSDKDCIALGLPHEKNAESPVEMGEWAQLESDAEKEILKLYPTLGSSYNIPEYFGDVNLKLAPFRLYHGVGPLNADRSIAFVGFAIWVNMFESAEITATWAVAYLDGNVKLPTLEEMKKNIAYTTAYMRLRVPTFGRIGNFYMYDMFSHQRQLLYSDLGLRGWQPDSWWSKWLRPSFPSNFKGIQAEYLTKYGSKTDDKVNAGITSSFSLGMNVLVTRAPKRVFEICDLDICPEFVSSACQSILTAVWNTRLPFISIDSPAKIAASILLDQFSLLVPSSTQTVKHTRLPTDQDINDSEDTDALLVDFCSGAGGPVPILEKICNASRKSNGLNGVKFYMTDLRPHVTAWSAAQMKSESGNLCYVASKVDATDPKLDNILSPQPMDYQTAEYEDHYHTHRRNPMEKYQDKTVQHVSERKTRLYRTFHLSFHHFDDSVAKKVLKSALEESDGFAIIELQDRRLCSVMSVAGTVGIFTVFLSGILMWGGFSQIFFTLVLPFIPLVMTWDGIVSCLRVREFDELIKLIEEVCPGKVDTNGKGNVPEMNGERAREGNTKVSEMGKNELVAWTEDWIFKSGRKKYLRIGGDVTWFVGRKICQ